MRYKETWSGQYRDINFEIQKFRFGPEDTSDRWTFYIYLSPEQLPEALRKDLITEVYFLTYGSRIETLPHDSFIYSLEWHGGLTYSKEESTKEMPFRFFKYGCDYQHLWDEGQRYSENSIEFDVKACIDSLYIRCPEIKKIDSLWEEFKVRFPKDSEYRRFDFNGNPIKEKL